jgi:glycosyltransferase involved in cell wall biosynthesis
MIYLVYLVLGFTALQFLISLTNFLFREKPGNRNQKISPLVSVLIPARNEEENIKIILDDLLKQDYKNIEIIVFNDQSEDKTAEIVSHFAKPETRIKLINSEGLPEGWLGKNFACHNLSMSAKGDYFLFIDADVRVSGSIIFNAVDLSIQHKLALISIFPKQIIKTLGEKITVPNMNYILLSLLPLILVRKTKFPSLAAANGQFMLFNSSIYKSINPHELMKSNKVEDIAIARLLKEKKHAIACLTGDETIRCRMYCGFKEAVNGFSKNVTAFFGNSMLLSLFFWATTTLGFIAVLLRMPLPVFVAYLIIYVLIRVMISVVSEQNVFLNLIYFIPQQLSCGLFIYKAFVNKYFTEYKWKGRSIK